MAYFLVSSSFTEIIIPCYPFFLFLNIFQQRHLVTEFHIDIYNDICLLSLEDPSLETNQIEIERETERESERERESARERERDFITLPDNKYGII